MMVAWACPVLINGYSKSDCTHDEDKKDDYEKPVYIIKAARLLHNNI